VQFAPWRDSCDSALADVGWVADITLIKNAAGFVYLVAILDACSRKIVSHAYGLLGFMSAPGIPYDREWAVREDGILSWGTAKILDRFMSQFEYSSGIRGG